MKYLFRDVIAICKKKLKAYHHDKLFFFIIVSLVCWLNQRESHLVALFWKMEKIKLKSPKIIGFGISNRKTFLTVNKYANGCIIGSAFIKHIQKNGISSIRSFVKGITS